MSKNRKLRYAKYLLPDGKIYHLNADFETGKEHLHKGRPVIDALGRFKGGKNVEYFLKAKFICWVSPKGGGR